MNLNFAKYLVCFSINLLMVNLCIAGNTSNPLAEGDKSFESFARELLHRNKGLQSLAEIKKLALKKTDANGRATPQLQKSLQAIDREFGDHFSRKEMQRFQGILGEVGVTTDRPIIMPENKTSYWLKEKQPLANYQFQENLPAKADVVIIGAGLTGSSAAYHLSLEAKKRGLVVVILDSGDPANEGSGRNGGNFELYPENFVGNYDGLEKERFKFLKKVYPFVPDSILAREAKHQAKVVMNFTSLNRDIFVDTIEKENIDADFNPAGWIRIAESAQEVEGLKKDVELAANQGRHVEIWSPEKIAMMTNIKTKFSGRWTTDGYYHPFKFVNGLLQTAIKNGVQLYTRTPVIAPVTSLSHEQHLVKTSKGIIEAKFVIAATNAFTKNIFKELHAIQPVTSQIMETTHVPVESCEKADEAALKGLNLVQAVSEMLVTAKKGDIYAHPMKLYRDEELAKKTKGRIAHRGSLIQGGGLDTPYDIPHKYRRKNSVFKTQLQDRKFLIEGKINKQPPARVWSGPMAFTPDGLMELGPLRPGVFIAAGMNGYGGSFTQAAGKAAAEAFLTGKIPPWAPQDVFSPQRLLSKEPLFDYKN